MAESLPDGVDVVATRAEAEGMSMPPLLVLDALGEWLDGQGLEPDMAEDVAKLPALLFVWAVLWWGFGGMVEAVKQNTEETIKRVEQAPDSATKGDSTKPLLP